MIMQTKENASSTLMTEGPIWKKIVLFALPLFLGNLFQQLYNTADSLIVGNFLGSDALAAVSSSGSLIFLMVGFFNGIALGADSGGDGRPDPPCGRACGRGLPLPRSGARGFSPHAR